MTNIDQSPGNVWMTAGHCLAQNARPMPDFLRTELSYRADSATLFEAVADLPWAVFLDSGLHHLTQSRYDVIAAEPHTTLVTRGLMTEIRNDGVELSREDPLTLLRRHLDCDPASACDLPFPGGAIGYFGYKCPSDVALPRLDDLGAILRDANEDPDVRAAAASALSFLGEPAYAYYNDMLKLIVEDEPGDVFRDADQSSINHSALILQGSLKLQIRGRVRCEVVL